MKTLEELWKVRDGMAKESTESCRKLGFSAGAICWLFKSGDYSFPLLIYWSLLFLVLFFLFDVLQFFISSLLYSAYVRRLEVISAPSGDDFEGVDGVPQWLNMPAMVLYMLKTVSLFACYLFIIVEIVRKII